MSVGEDSVEKGQGCAGRWWRLAVAGGAVGRRRITPWGGAGAGRWGGSVVTLAVGGEAQ